MLINRRPIYSWWVRGPSSGFNAVGQHAAHFLAAEGAILVAASDSHGAIHDPAGLEVACLTAHKQAGHQLTSYDHGTPLGRDDVVATDCDIWIPAARPDVLRADNVERLRTRLVLQGANTMERLNIAGRDGILPREAARRMAER